MADAIVPRLVDVGARFGLHPSLRGFLDVGEFHLFEPDPEEAKRLSGIYGSKHANVSVHDLALSDRPGTLSLKLRKHRALSSFYDFNAEMFSSMNYMSAEIEAEREVDVQVATLDQFFESRPLDIVKLDTEGSEYDILQGAVRQMNDHVLALRCEVTFNEVLPGRPMFGDLHKLIVSHGFVLLNLDYVGKGVARSPFTRGARYGQLLSTDAVWIASDETLLKKRGSEVARNMLVLAHFLFQNSASDVAVAVLLRGLEQQRELFSSLRGSKLAEVVRKDVASLIKDLSYVPGSRHEDLAVVYEDLFGQKFPPLHDYYYHFA